MCVSMPKKFWFGKEGHVDYRDVMIHAVLVVGLNLGLRFDEVNKLKNRTCDCSSRCDRDRKHRDVINRSYQKLHSSEGL